MKRNDLNAIITGIVHRYIEDGWVLEMCNSSYSDVVGVHFLSRGRERVAVGNGDCFSVTSFWKR